VIFALCIQIFFYVLHAIFTLKKFFFIVVNHFIFCELEKESLNVEMNLNFKKVKLFLSMS